MDKLIFPIGSGQFSGPIQHLGWYRECERQHRHERPSKYQAHHRWNGYKLRLNHNVYSLSIDRKAVLGCIMSLGIMSVGAHCAQPSNCQLRMHCFKLIAIAKRKTNLDIQAFYHYFEVTCKHLYSDWIL